MPRLIFLFSATVLLLGHTVSAQAQEPPFDRIIKVDKSAVEGRVLRVTETAVEVDPEGTIPFILVPRDSVDFIVYSDNTVGQMAASGSTTSPTIPSSATASESETLLRKHFEVTQKVKSRTCYDDWFYANYRNTMKDEYVLEESPRGRLTMLFPLAGEEYTGTLSPNGDFAVAGRMKALGNNNEFYSIWDGRVQGKQLWATLTDNVKIDERLGPDTRCVIIWDVVGTEKK